METSKRTINLNSTKNSLLIVIGAGVLFGFLILYRLLWSADTYVKDMEQMRAEKNEFFREDKDSPLPDSLRLDFKGLDYYAPDRNFRVTARFVKNEKFEAVKIPQNKPGETDEYIVAGKLQFSINDQPYSLTAYQMNKRDSQHLFVPFRDATNGKTTYGGGRYLEDVRIVNRTADLDFNKAYNPYCVYNYQFVCPVPPPENTLPIEIAAGEKMYKQ